MAMRQRITTDGAIPAKYKILLAVDPSPNGVGALAARARAAGASEDEIMEALEVRRLIGGNCSHEYGSRRTALPRLVKLAACIALWGTVLLVAAGLLIHSAPASRADRCGDPQASADGCADPGASVGGPSPRPPWLGALQQRDPEFVDSYTAMRERILKDGAIPAKYKLLTGMVTDAIAAHPDGVKTLADNARAAGASEAEVTEAVEVGYLYGGTAALVMGANAFRG